MNFRRLIENRGRMRSRREWKTKDFQSHQYKEGIGLCDQRCLMKKKQLVYKKDNLLIIEN